MICRHYQITWASQLESELDAAARRDKRQVIALGVACAALTGLGWLLHAAYLALQVSR